VTGIAVADDDSTLIAEPTLKLDVLASPLAAEQNEASVYSAYWQADIDLARSGLP
jgi:hypothetical protein